jgi:hypothetical protein
MVVAAQTGCMPDFDAITSKWQPAGRGGKAGASSGGGQAGQAGAAAGGTSSGGKAGGQSSGGKSNGNAGKPGTGGTGTGGSGAGGTGPGGEAGTENAGNAGQTEGGSTGVGGTGTGGASSGTGGTSASGGEGGAVCEPGFTTCPGFEDCATNVSQGNPDGSTVENCGACGVTCSTANATSAACTAGVCRPTCSPNFADCNGTSSNDGCEADLTNVASCGACDHRCSLFGTSARACTTGRCAPTCAAGYLDCTADDGAHADDGCETYTDTLAGCGSTCSDPGLACAPEQVCNAGVCGAASGLVAMTVPFTDSGQGQRYADVFTAAPDLTYATVTARIYAPGATNGTLSAYLTDTALPAPGFSAYTTVSFETLAAGWTDVVVAVPPPGGTFDTAHLHQLTFDFDSIGAHSTSPTVFYLDSVWSSDGVIHDTFDTTTQSMITSGLKKLDGSSFPWVSAIP